MNYIEHICEPQKLLLCWRAPDSLRFAVAELSREREQYTFRYLRDTPDFIEASKLGFTMYPPFTKDKHTYTSGVLEAFIGRVPPRSRNDFKEYLQNFRINENAFVSDFALLGYTGAKLPSDGFSIVNPFENVCAPCEFVIELAGTRYMKGIDLKSISIGDAIQFVEEPQNEYDPNAIFVLSREQKLGYISRWQTHAFKQWIRNPRITISANVERLNGTSDRPLIYIFLRIRDV